MTQISAVFSVTCVCVSVTYYCEILLESHTRYNSAYLSGLDTHLLRIYTSDTNLPNYNSGGKS